ncbi:efflux RND transporter permease subunit [Pusillimonas sp. CC-YST705]|uniref:Efflux RND transporter permease subunit n=1 Tax=Mesopusillimonas faecipullorum TaxID=2755040 RepID=A0ABS8C8R3_9BURK|nr:efflux RND transporter permease subunit [Mesopusillimonas faecipullorum]MCB5362415.1 efflux RND transporter permease subunit [Mesopusillimonas faecipullorum]
MRFNLSAWGLRHAQLVVFGMILSVVLGVLAYFDLGRSEDPEMTIMVMVVDVAWPGATTTEMQQQVVEKIQRTLQEVPLYDYTRSYVRPGRATMFLTLKDWAKKDQIQESWYQARKRVGDIRHTLPEGVIGPFFNDDFGDTFGSIYVFHADGFDHAQMKQVLLSARERLLQVPDVSKVQLLGVQEQKFYVEFSPAQLAQLGLSPTQLLSSLQQQNIVMPAGIIEGPRSRIAMRVEGAVKSVEDIEQIPIAVGGRSMRLGDVASVSRGYVDPPESAMRRDGQAVTALAVSMTEGGDILGLGQNLDAAIAQVQAELPAGIIIEKIVDQPTLVDHSINEFLLHFLLALAIVLAVSLIALGWRTGLVVALSVPLVLGITFFIMWRMGIHLHRVSLGALIIALGLLVDDAIIAVEMMQVKMEQGWERAKAASYAWTSTAFPMLTGTLITAAGFVPVGFARSSTSEFTQSIFWVVTLALLVSWLVAVLFTPYLGTLLLPDMAKHHERDTRWTRFKQRLMNWLTHRIAWSVSHRKTVLVAALLAFVAALGAFRLVPLQFFPDSPREEVLVDLQLEEGASYAATLAETKKLEQWLADDPRVRAVTAYVGSGSPRFYLALEPELPKPNYAQLIIYPHDLEQGNALAASLQEHVAAEFSHLRSRVYRLELGPPVGYPVQFRVKGADPDTVRDIAGQVRDIVRNHPNTRDVNLQWSERSKALRFRIDQDRARALGVNSQDVAMTLQAMLSGQTVTQVRDGNELIDVVARARADERLDAEQLGSLAVHTATGRSVPLSQVADIEPVLEEGGLWMRDRLPSLGVRADVSGAQAPDVSAEIRLALRELEANLPVGYEIQEGGVAEESAKANAAIGLVVPVMLLLWAIFLMLQLQSFSRMFMVLLTAPLGMVGVTLALLVTQMPFGFVATLGVIALAGMVMRNAVILVEQIDRDIAEGESPRDAIIHATVRRTRPVVLTALAAILAMIPLTISALWGPMAVSIMGGLAVGTVLTLIFVPALYAAWFRVEA